LGDTSTRFTQAWNNEWIEEYWNRNGDRYWKCVWNAAGTMTAGSKETLAGIWSEEYWGGAQEYWCGIWNAGNNMVERYIRRADERILETWNEARDYGRTVYDGAGKLVSQTGTFFSSIAEAFGLPW
jgi:hypothetical protein